MPKPSLNFVQRILGFVIKRSDEAYARAEAMRLLLQKAGVFSEEEFSRLYDALLKQQKVATKGVLTHLEKDALDEEQRQWLAALKLTVQ